MYAFRSAFSGETEGIQYAFGTFSSSIGNAFRSAATSISSAADRAAREISEAAPVRFIRDLTRPSGYAPVRSEPPVDFELVDIEDEAEARERSRPPPPRPPAPPSPLISVPETFSPARTLSEAINSLFNRPSNVPGAETTPEPKGKEEESPQQSPQPEQFQAAAQQIIEETAPLENERYALPEVIGVAADRNADITRQEAARLIAYVESPLNDIRMVNGAVQKHDFHPVADIHDVLPDRVIVSSALRLNTIFGILGDRPFPSDNKGWYELDFILVKGDTGQAIPHHLVITRANIHTWIETFSKVEEDYEGTIVRNVNITRNSTIKGEKKTGGFLDKYVPINKFFYVGTKNYLHRYQIPYQSTDLHEAIEREYIEFMAANEGMILTLQQFFNNLPEDRRQEVQEREEHCATGEYTPEMSPHVKLCLQHALDVNAEQRGYPHYQVRAGVNSMDAVPTAQLPKMVNKPNEPHDDNKLSGTIRLYSERLKDGKTSAYRKCFPAAPRGQPPIAPIYDIAIYNSHYFYNEEYTTTYPNGDLIPVNVYPIPSPNTSFHWIRKLINDNILVDMSYDQLLEVSEASKRYVPVIDNPESVCEIVPYAPSDMKISEQNPYVVYFDFEATTDGPKHIPIMLVARIIYPTAEVWSEEKVRPRIPNPDEYHCYAGPECAQAFLNKLASLPPLPYYYDNEDGTVTKAYHRPIVAYAHNLSYDIKYLLPHMTLNSWFGGTTKCKGAIADLYRKDRTHIIFRDSLALLNFALEKFPKMFSFEDEKIERTSSQGRSRFPLKSKLKFPYGFFSQANIANNKLTRYRDNNATTSMEELLSHAPELTADELRSDLEQAGACTSNGKVLYWKYLEYYCALDVFILERTMEKFQAAVSQALDSDAPEDDKFILLNEITISGLADHFFKQRGVYDNVASLAGSVRDFVGQAVRGGRTLTNSGVGWEVEDVIYIDAVSLYPSAQEELGGYPMGLPKKITPELLIAPYTTLLDNTRITSWVARVEIHSNPSAGLPFPLLSAKTKDGIVYFNQPEDYIVSTPDGNKCVIVLSSIGLENLMTFGGFVPGRDFTILEGFYWDEGRNDKLKSTIRHLFELRRQYKREADPAIRVLEQVIKLIMNSTYGKTLQKPYTRRVQYKTFATEDDLLSYVSMNHHLILTYSRVQRTDGQISAVFETFHNRSKHQNFAHCGAEVLDTSKRIMYRVFQLCYELGIRIFYTDTDSIQMQGGRYQELCDAYRERYGRNLHGSDLGQFHPDFEPPPPPQFYKAVEDPTHEHPVSVKGYILGKKSLYHKVEYQVQVRHVAPDTEEMRVSITAIMQSVKDNSPLLHDGTTYHTENPHNMYYEHVRMKGIPNRVLVKASPNGVEDTFRLLSEGHSIPFDLASAGIRMRYTKQGDIVTLSQMIRRVAFPPSIKAV